MSRATKGRIILYGSLIVIVILIIGGKIARQAKSDALNEAYTGIVAVKGVVVSAEKFDRVLDASGVLTGNKEAMIAAETGGRVVEVKVDAGDVVKQGDVLIRLDDELYSLEAARAKIAYDKAKMDLDRLEKLYAQKSISESDLEAARLGVKGAEVGWKMANKTYRDATIRAPFSGTVAGRMTEVGQMVERGMPVVQLVDVSSLKLTVQIAENDVRFLANGQPAQVVIDALGDTVKGTVTSVGSRANTGTRTFPVELRVTGSSHLKSGMFARAVIGAGQIESGMLLPRSAVLSDVGRTVVFLASGNTVTKRVVRTLGNAADRVAVDGIQIGDTVITTGNQNLSQGSKISLTIEARG